MRHRDEVVTLTSHAAALLRMLLRSIIVPTKVGQRSLLRNLAKGVLVRILNVRLQEPQRKRGKPCAAPQCVTSPDRQCGHRSCRDSSIDAATEASASSVPPTRSSRTPSFGAARTFLEFIAVPKRRTRETEWVEPMLFSVRASANRHAGSLLISSTRAGETGLTKVKNFSRGVLRASRSNDFPDRLFTSRRTTHGFPAFEPKKYFRSR